MIQEKLWVYPEMCAQSPPAELKALSVHPILAQLLFQRGLSNAEEAYDFLTPHRSHCISPDQMYNMRRAVSRIAQAITHKEHIRIYGDYDVDGTTGVALLYLLLREKAHKVSYYLPMRHPEGYGLSVQGVEDAKRAGASLLIAVDCGTSDYKAADVAQRLSIDLMICDHHLTQDPLPPCYTILNPQQSKCSYPNKALSGCAIAFKLAEALAEQDLIHATSLWRHVDLVALSLIADQMVLSRENRALVHLGLQTLRQKQGTLGLQVLSQSLGVSFSCIDTDDLGYRIGPAINAAGRMSSATKAVDVLVASEESRAKEDAKLLCKLNQSRKETQQFNTSLALRMLHNTDEAHGTFLFHKDFHPGVSGIVAARCMELYPRPTMILSQIGDKIVGSLRTLGEVNAYELLVSCQEALTRFGGHKYAAGCSLAPPQIKRFQALFEAALRTLSPAPSEPSYSIDMPLSLTEITEDLYTALEKLAPYGKGNPRPIFFTTNIRPYVDQQSMKHSHLFLRLPIPSAHRSLRGVGFGMRAALEPLKSGAPCAMAYEIHQNKYFSHKNTLDLHILDIKFD